MTSDVRVAMDDGLVLDVRELRKHFPVGHGRRSKHAVRAVDGVSLAVASSETLGLVGESGCGKTSLGRSIIRAIDPTGGSIVARIQREAVDVTTLRQRQLRDYRRTVQMIYQDPFSSLNPRMTVSEIISEPLVALRLTDRVTARSRAGELLSMVGLPSRAAQYFPHAFSGGQRQRIGIARALASSPKLVICDEPVSALDVSIRGQILNLLLRFQRDMQLAMIFISHDLSVVRHMSDRVAVMYLGRLAEVAPADDLFAHPMHPYTEALLSALPVSDPRADRSHRIVLNGEIPDGISIPAGCRFHTRCRYATALCRSDEPQLRPIPERSANHHAACHYAGHLDLRGFEVHGRPR